jgi:4-diphosphocytidyl-2C-methyl-D-erythritol kinase
MSGSGSAVFGIFEKKQDLKSKFKEHFYFECEL